EFISDRINDIKRSGNFLYVANIKGVFVFDIRQMEIKNGNLSLPVFIQGVSSKNDFHIEQNSVLNYAENFIHISFTGLSYSLFGKLNYAYKLEGLETEWHYTKNLSLDYFNLPPGNYKFIIKAIAGNAHESIHPAIFSFTISPPFWKTSWFIFLISAVFSTTLYLVFRYRIFQIRREEKRKADIKIYTANMEARSLRAQMNPHFIFNALNSIQNFVMKNDKNSAQAYLSKFARLIRNILEFSQVDFILLRNEIETLGLYIELEKLRASDKFQYSIVAEDSIAAGSIYIPAMIIQPVVENSILHGLLPMEKENGMLKISFTKKDRVVSCTIEDNGVGRIKAKELNLMKQKQHRSMGTSIINERLDILKEIHSLDATCIVEDLYDHENLSCGTRVTLTFPFKNKPE
ncbi:MAG TPA: histidine kinase, partial [Bacteroidia bacterium]|nr:histidine kinase [Bacteroidia bacterium]